MYALNKTIISFCKDESGATAIEYGLISALVGLGIIGGAQTLGDNVQSKFYQLGSSVNNAGAPSPPMRGTRYSG